MGCGPGSASCGADAFAAPVRAEDAPTAPTALQCRIVRSASRMWVGFSDGLGLQDAEMLAHAGTAVVKALDLEMCALGAGHAGNRALAAERAALLRVMSTGQRFEVTKMNMAKHTTLDATIRLHSVARAVTPDAPGKPSTVLTWQAVMSGGRRGWKLLRLERASVP